MTKTNRLTVDDEKSWFRYMPVSRDAKYWGAYVINAGFTVVPPGVAYPPYKHPPDHHFSWERGRVLPTYIFVYITRGAGVFDSKPSGTLAVRAGDLMLLFPQTWHRYRPSTDTGWDEYWLEFDGDYIHRLMAREEFAPEHPVQHIGLRDDILDLFLKSLEILRNEPPEYQLLLGTLATQTIARVLSALKQKSYEDRPIAEVIREAKRWLVSEPAKHENLDHLASRLNMSYSSFRRLFKTETGFSPRQFMLEANLRKAADLLIRTDTPVHRIAEQCGMESIYYFSRLFKKKNGCPPTAFRQSHGKTPN
jgi:AraC-like DNA-binding protein